jgi:hypothetical protein
MSKVLDVAKLTIAVAQDAKHVIDGTFEGIISIIGAIIARGSKCGNALCRQRE